jgi:L-iditol 2-dehydrogenase
MKAVHLSAPGQVEVREVPVPSLEAGDILVAMGACGLCGTDIEKMRGLYTAAPPVLGHEAAGAVVAVGEGVDGVRPGDRVFPHHHVPCGECEYCRRGSPTMCPEYRQHHLDPGGFAERFRVPAWIVARGGVLPLPDGVSFEDAAFVEPLACCLRALDRFRVPDGADVLLLGAGPMGLLLQQLLPRYGAAEVIVSEPSPYRRRFAERLGADRVLDPRREDVGERVRGRTGGRGADLVVVATGSGRALRDAFGAVRDGGTVGLVGLPAADVPIEDASQLVTRELAVLASNAATEDETQRALDLIGRRAVNVADLVTHRFPLASFADAVAVAEKGEAMKVLLTP